MVTRTGVAPGFYQVTPDPAAALAAMPGSDGRQINAKTPCGSIVTTGQATPTGTP